MARTFAYCRVSTAEQTTDNQAQEIAQAGFFVEPPRVLHERISGSTEAFQRPTFTRLVDRLEPGDVLIVTKLDRLGRNAMDVRATVDRLASGGIKVHCLALGGVDLTSPAGRMTMQVIAAVAEFERDLLIERTHAGISRAKAQGKTFGRPMALSPEQQAVALEMLSRGVPVASIARDLKCGRATVNRLRDRAQGVEVAQ